jgi:hypothetical protein
MEFSNIQPVSQNGDIQNIISIKNAADLVSIFRNRANAGDQIELFLAFAEQQPGIAIEAFNAAIGQTTNSPIKALALQGFGRVPHQYKDHLSSCESDISKELLLKLSNDTRKRGDDLIRWAAAQALIEIGFTQENIQHPEGGNLAEHPNRTQKRILERRIQEVNTIQRLNFQGEFTAEYESYLEFWIYGPTIDLFDYNHGHPKYLDIVSDILRFTQIRGVQLGLNSSNDKVRELSFNLATNIFRDYYRSGECDFRKALGGSLKRFLKLERSSDSDLQNLAKVFAYDPLISDFDGLRLTQLTYDNINELIAQLKLQRCETSNTFSSAINVSGELVISDFLSRQRDQNIKQIDSWIKKLDEQAKIVSALSVSQTENTNLVSHILNSIREDDETLYLQIKDEIHKRLQQLNSCEDRTQDELNLASNQLSEIKQLICKSLSERINGLRSETASLESSSSKNMRNVCKMLKYGLGLLTISLFAEVVAAIGIILMVLISLMLGALAR